MVSSVETTTPILVNIMACMDKRVVLSLLSSFYLVLRTSLICANPWGREYRQIFVVVYSISSILLIDLSLVMI